MKIVLLRIYFYKYDVYVATSCRKTKTLFSKNMKLVF